MINPFTKNKKIKKYKKIGQKYTPHNLTIKTKKYINMHTVFSADIESFDIIVPTITNLNTLAVYLHEIAHIVYRHGIRSQTEAWDHEVMAWQFVKNIFNLEGLEFKKVHKYVLFCLKTYEDTEYAKQAADSAIRNLLS